MIKIFLSWKCLKQGTGITMLSDGTSVTINGIDAYNKTEVYTKTELNNVK